MRHAEPLEQWRKWMTTAIVFEMMNGGCNYVCECRCEPPEEQLQNCKDRILEKVSKLIPEERRHLLERSV